MADQVTQTSEDDQQRPLREARGGSVATMSEQDRPNPPPTITMPVWLWLSMCFLSGFGMAYFAENIPQAIRGLCQ